MVEETSYFIGVEGGGTKSFISLYSNQSAEQMVTACRDCTNPYSIGTDKAAEVIMSGISECLEGAHLQIEKLKGIGMGLSGGAQDDSSERLIAEIRRVEPRLPSNIVVVNDTMSSLFTVSDSGGVLLISGTGSNCVFVNREGSSVSCGGWGHLLGDEGSAYWLSNHAIRRILRIDDGFDAVTWDTSRVRGAIYSHFGITSNAGLLPHFYNTFEKSFIASLAIKLSKIANEGDAMASDVFRCCGEQLGRHVVAVLSSDLAMSDELIRRGESIMVICVGGMWNSWNLLRNGFIDGLSLNEDFLRRMRGKEINMLRMTGSATPGAALLAAKNIAETLPINRQLSTILLDNLHL